MAPPSFVRLKTALVILSLGMLPLLAGCSSPPSSDTPHDPIAAGRHIYATNCAICHMIDGAGVPNMQPALQGDAIVSGDPTRLIRVVLDSPAGVLPVNRPGFTTTMPPFRYLSDQDLADVLTYVRQQFGADASPIQPSQVAVLRN